MTFVALPWFVLVTSGSGSHGVVPAVEIAPMALLGVPSGSLIARLGARSTMLLSDAVRAPLIALVPILHWSGQLELSLLLLVIVFALGAFTAPYIARRCASIVPRALR